VVSGGQTGVDRAALDAALEAGIPCGGWCPRNRAAEDGPIPLRYPLSETASEDAATRTELNVLGSDGTLVLTTGNPHDGTPFTVVCAEHHRKPMLVIDIDKPVPFSQVQAWLEQHSIGVLNIAGPRESHRPGMIYRTGLAYLKGLFGVLGQPGGLY
jgi:hypothetical protein